MRGSRAVRAALIFEDRRRVFRDISFFRTWWRRGHRAPRRRSRGLARRKRARPRPISFERIARDYPHRICLTIHRAVTDWSTAAAPRRTFYGLVQSALSENTPA